MIILSQGYYNLEIDKTTKKCKSIQIKHKIKEFKLNMHKIQDQNYKYLSQNYKI